jgi:hypothetical protein
MSRSLVACAIDAGTTTIIRAKSSGPSSIEMTSCRTIGYGLDALGGPKRKKAASRLSDALTEWADEPLSLCISPSAIMTLPAWFPAGSTKAQREVLGRIEAGYFLSNVDEWIWHTMPLAPEPDQPADLEQQMMMFYAAEPVSSFAEEMGRRCRLGMHGLHIEPVVRLTAGTSEPMAVLELEEKYAAFFVSRGGRAEYFRYWPVKNASEREFFAITELGASQVEKVQVTGLAADTATMRRIAAGTPRTLEPLGLPPQVSSTGKTRGCISSTGIVRAASTALMALSPPG